MSRLLVIAPYEGLKDLFLEVNEELQKDIHVEVGNLYRGLAVAKQLENEGFDVIISRGATASLLREHCRLPVVEIGISGYDILRTLALVKGFSEKIGLMCYWNTIHGADAIGTLLGINLTFFRVERDQAIEPVIQKALDQGIEVIIGDVISTAMAEKFGVKAVLINSGKEAVIEAIQEAEHMGYYTWKEKSRRLFLEGLFNHLQEGIIAIDKEGSVMALNARAEQVLDIHKDFMMGKKLAQIPGLGELLPFFETAAENKEQIVTVNGEELLLRKRQIRWEKDNSAQVLIFQKTSSIYNVQNLIRVNHILKDQRAPIHFNHLIANSPAMKEVLQKAKVYASSSCPLLIVGERGTGKQSLAQAIHNASPRKDGPFICLYPHSFNEQSLIEGWLGNDEKSRMQDLLHLANGGTVYIRNIETWIRRDQERFVRGYLQVCKDHTSSSPQVPPFRLIASSEKDLPSMAKEGQILDEFYSIFRDHQLRLPPLRERTEDIHDLVRWFIAFFNPEIGKQIVGCHPAAIKRLKEYRWPGNISELKWIVEKICLNASGVMIEEWEVENVLGVIREERPSVSRKLDISGKTLEQIEQEVIRMVMEEEQYNQSQAAKRLGINRSTLWRKTKKLLKKK